MPTGTLRATLDLGVAGQVTQRRASIAQQFHGPIVGAETDKVAKDRRRNRMGDRAVVGLGESSRRAVQRSGVEANGLHPTFCAGPRRGRDNGPQFDGQLLRARLLDMAPGRCGRPTGPSQLAARKRALRLPYNDTLTSAVTGYRPSSVFLIHRSRCCPTTSR